MINYKLKPFSQVQDQICRFIVENRETNTEDLVKWRYNKLVDLDDINALAFDKDNLIGLKSYFIRKIIIKGTEYYLADSGHIQVEKDYEGKGIFSKLLSLASKQAEHYGIHCLFCNPTRKIMRIFLKQDWENVGNIIEYSKRISIYSKLVSFIPSRLVCKFFDRVYVGWSIYLSWYPFVDTSNYTLSEVADFNDKYEILCRTVNESIPVMRLRDRKFLTWRFLEKPIKMSNYKIFELTCGVELRGYIVLLFRGESKIVTIVDFLSNYKDIPVLLKMTVNHLRFFGENRISKVLVGISEKHHFENIFKSFGFRKSKNNLPVIIKLCGKFDTPNSLNPLLSGIENWHITYADKDTV